MAKAASRRKPPKLSAKITVVWTEGGAPGMRPKVKIADVAIDALIDAGELGEISAQKRSRLTSRAASCLEFYLMAENAYRAQATRRQKAFEYAAVLRLIDRCQLVLADLLQPLISFEVGHLSRTDPTEDLEKQIATAEATVRALYSSHSDLQVKLAEFVAYTKIRHEYVDERLAKTGASKPALAHLVHLANGLWFKTIGCPHSPTVCARQIAFARTLFELVGLKRTDGAIGKSLRQDNCRRGVKLLREK